MRLRQLRTRELTVEVPLDHFTGAPGSLTVFARIIEGPGGADKPYLLYLQGGPGVEAFRPTPAHPGWLSAALRRYRVVMLDQRGTGLSSPIGWADGRFCGTGTAQDPAAVAEHMRHYRADAIVEDAEAVRAALGVPTWTVLGQSFGGFTALRYMAAHPESLAGVMFAGGLPRVPLAGDDPDPAVVYARTWEILKGKSQAFAQAHPAASHALRALWIRASEGGIALPDGTVMGPAHVRSLGILLGRGGGARQLSYLLEWPPDSPVLRHDALQALPFSARNPLYAAFHESCWASGVSTRWAALRARPAAAHDDPLWLSGEHVDPVFFASGPLAVWADVAHAVAEVPWPVLWDPQALRAADVPAAAAIYADDAFVPREFSERTAALLPRVKTWVTGDFEHNGLNASADYVFQRLCALLDSF